MWGYELEDGSGRLLLEDGSGIYGVDSTPATVEIEYDIGRFTEEPYQYPRICRFVRLSWTSTNIDAVRAYIVGLDGAETLLEYVSGDGFTTSGHDYSLYAQNQDKYAGSWEQDYGVGFVTDLGADADGDGISATVMADPEHVASFGLLDGGQPDKLRIEIDLADRTVPVHFDYPVFKAAATDKYVFWESRQALALTWSNGPGLRIGDQDYESGGSVSLPPTVRAPGSPQSVTDWMAWKRAYLLGTDPTSGVSAELATFYDSDEGQTIAQCANQCLAFLMPFRLGNVFYCGFVNGFDTPPLALAPLKALSTRDWDRDGVRTLEVVQLSVEPRYGVTDGGSPMHWKDSGGTTWTTTTPLPLLRWTVTKHLHAVDNNESLGLWYKSAKDMGEMRPWHGAYALWDGSQPTGSTGQWCWEDRNGRYQRVDTNADGIEFHGVDWSRPYPGFDRTVQVTSDPTDTNPKIYEDRHLGRFWVVFDRGSDVRWTYSDDYGRTWSTSAVALASCHSATGNSSPFDGLNVVAALKFVSGSSAPCVIRSIRQRPGDASFGSAYTFTDGSADIQFEDETFHIFPAFDGSGRWILTAKAYGDTGTSEWESFDQCLTWAQI